MTPTFSQLLRSPVHLLAFGLGAGCLPIAPGTLGTLVAVPLYWLLFRDLPLGLYAGLLLAVVVSGIWICDRTARDLGVHDHPGIVWDEIAGFLLTMMFAPAGWVWTLVGFVLFRIFDIAKPWPIRRIDREVGGGWGIMLDDLLAAVYAAAVMFLILRVGLLDGF